MLNFFKRAAADPGSSAKTPQNRKPTQKGAKNFASLDPLPTPEVTEGNEESDWALWEDSVSFQDSQFQPMAASQRSVQEKQAAQTDEPAKADAFASVHKRAP